MSVPKCSDSSLSPTDLVLWLMTATLFFIYLPFPVSFFYGQPFLIHGGFLDQTVLYAPSQKLCHIFGICVQSYTSILNSMTATWFFIYSPFPISLFLPSSILNSWGLFGPDCPLYSPISFLYSILYI